MKHLLPTVFLILLLSLCSCACQHEYLSNATCTSPPICKGCGAAQGETLEHYWKDATCTSPKTCYTCGKSEGSPIEHSWKNATCSSPKTCKTCGEKQGSALGHNWENATCTSSKTCKACGKKQGSALGHNWETSSYDSIRICQTCGQKNEDDVIAAEKLAIYKKIAQNIECRDYETAIKLCNQLSSVSQEGKDIVMNALVKELNSQMKSTLTSFYTESSLVDDGVIAKFKQYKKIVDKMQITTADYTNVVKYIDLILSTEKYMKYDPLWYLMRDVLQDMEYGQYYFDCIKNSSLFSLQKTYATLARNFYQSCYNTSLQYNTSDFGIAKTREIFKYYVDELTNFINYGHYAGNSQLASEWDAIMKEGQSKWNELLDILENEYPTSVYYGE